MFNIYIIDDNPLFSETLNFILCSAFPSAKITKFPNGKNLLSGIESEKPDLIFMDINMPGMDGITLTKKIKEKNETIAIIVITSYDDADYAASAMDAGADGFLSKKINSIEGILKITNSVIDNMA